VCERERGGGRGGGEREGGRRWTCGKGELQVLGCLFKCLFKSICLLCPEIGTDDELEERGAPEE
jgi:hypothetical protein